MASSIKSWTTITTIPSVAISYEMVSSHNKLLKIGSRNNCKAMSFVICKLW